VTAKWLPRAEAQLGRVQLVVPAGAQVLVDGKPAAADPSLGVFEVVAGDHDIAAVSAGRSETEHVTASAGATLTMRMLVDDPAATPSPPAPTMLESPEEPPASPGPSAEKIATAASLGGAALVGVGLGIGFGLAASGKAAAIEGGEGCSAGVPTSIMCQHLSYDVSVEHRYEWVSIGSYVGAGVLGAAGLAAWVFWPRASARVSALVDGRQVGLGLEGRW